VKKLEHFELKKEHAVFCPVGQASFAEVSELLSRAVLRCRKEKIKKLLIDSTGLPEFQPPELAERKRTSRFCVVIQHRCPKW
jgi:hypothetical protein